MAEMSSKGINHPDYERLKKEWLIACDTEWRRTSAILSREQQEELLANGEIKTAEAIERIAEDIRKDRSGCATGN